MARRLVIALIVAWWAWLAAGPAFAAKRVALVIGNGAYKETDKLTNPINDAADMIAALKRLGFEVLEGLDLDKRGMERIIRQFDLALSGADIGFFFYAGHGLQIGGQNYHVPTDAKLAAEGDVDFESLPLNLILRRMEREARTSLVLLDACRDNPLARNLARTMGTRGGQIGQGLGEVKTGVGTLIGFSTQPGNVALDGRGRNSPYTSALLKEIETPGRDILSTLAAVRGTVVKATSGKQVPWEHTSLLGPVVLKEAAVTSAPPIGAPAKGMATAPSVSAPAGEAERAWTRIESSNDIPTLEAFVRRFRDSFYGDLAQRRLEDLKRAAAAEEQRVALLQQQQAAAAARKRAEEEAKAAAELTRAGRVFRDCPECPEMVVVPAGSFMIGSSSQEIEAVSKELPAGADWFKVESPQRSMTIAKPFAVGKFELTFAEWEACVAGGGCASNKSPEDQGWGKGRRPVINVSWDDAKEYVAWLSRKTGKTYWLLSEAEWEYMARAGTTSRYSWGDDIGKTHANCAGCGSQWDSRQTAPVGSFKANPFGLHDLHGNVSEWVEDTYRPNYQGAPTDGSVWQGGDTSFRVLRGGSWFSYPQFLRSADRDRDRPDGRNGNVGFRISRTL